MEENKIIKYLKYAIGEIVLVVIGILIAVSINNYNDVRKTKILERGYLSDINAEFQMNKKEFQKVIKSHRSILDSHEQMLAMFPISVDNKDSIHALFVKDIFVSYLFNPSQSSLESLKNSASFDLITDKKLQFHLLSWDEIVTDYKEEENALSHFMEHSLSPFLIIHANFTKNQYFVFDEDANAANRMFENMVFRRKILLDDLVNNKDQEYKLVEESIDVIISRTRTYD